MELGNIIFGNSRGECEVPREDKWEAPLFAFFDRAGLSSYGFPERDDGVSENHVFCVRSYDWDAHCDCGFDDLAEQWHEAHPHGADCYRTELDALMRAYDVANGWEKIEEAAFGPDRNLESALFGGMNLEQSSPAPGVFCATMTPRTDQTMEVWRKASDARRAYEDKQQKKLCAARGLSYPGGCAVHCDCYKSAAADSWFSANAHSEACRMVQPNFLHKPSGFSVHWYKYPLRDSYMTPMVTLERWREIFRECEESLTA